MMIEDQRHLAGKQLGISSKATVYKVDTKEIAGYDEVRMDFSYRSKRSTMLHFRLGNVNKVDVRVQTGDGRTATFSDLDADKAHLLDIEKTKGD